MYMQIAEDNQIAEEADGADWRGGAGGGHGGDGVPLPGVAVPVPAAASRARDGRAPEVPAGGAGGARGGPAQRPGGVHAGVVAHARQGRRRPRSRRRRGARRLDGEAPVGAGQVRGDRGRVQGEADRHVPGLRRHAVAHRRRPRRRLHEREDADGRAQRRQAVPDGDRQRPVPRQGVRVREAGGAVLRRQPRHGHQGPGQILLRARQVQGQRSSVPASKRVPAHDRAGASAADRGDEGRTRGQGGEQQVLRLRPLQMRRRKGLGGAGGDGEGGGAGVPSAAAVAGADGVRGAAHHQVGQGQGAGVFAGVAGLRRLQQRPPGVHRRRPHRRGRLQGAAAAGAGRGDPGVEAPQGDQRVLLAAGARGGDGVPAPPRRVEAARQGAPQAAPPGRRRMKTPDDDRGYFAASINYLLLLLTKV